MFAAEGISVDSIVGVLAGVVGGGAVLAYVLRQPACRCVGCNAEMPKVRKPAGLRQLLWGCWTCPHCGVEMDRQGRRVVS